MEKCVYVCVLVGVCERERDIMEECVSKRESVKECVLSTKFVKANIKC